MADNPGHLYHIHNDCVHICHVPVCVLTRCMRVPLESSFYCTNKMIIITTYVVEESSVVVRPSHAGELDSLQDIGKIASSRRLLELKPNMTTAYQMNVKSGVFTCDLDRVVSQQYNDIKIMKLLQYFMEL